jgi:hypothetical protein
MRPAQIFHRKDENYSYTLQEAFYQRGMEARRPSDPAAAARLRMKLFFHAAVRHAARSVRICAACAERVCKISRCLCWTDSVARIGRIQRRNPSAEGRTGSSALSVRGLCGQDAVSPHEFGGENGGGGEIRTRGTLRPVGFQDRCIRPLCHPSKLFIFSDLRGFSSSAILGL